jgi:hypothetical protein
VFELYNWLWDVLGTVNIQFHDDRASWNHSGRPDGLLQRNGNGNGIMWWWGHPVIRLDSAQIARIVARLVEEGKMTGEAQWVYLGNGVVARKSAIDSKPRLPEA